jgi:hypothetical protein
VAQISTFSKARPFRNLQLRKAFHQSSSPKQPFENRGVYAFQNTSYRCQDNTGSCGPLLLYVRLVTNVADPHHLDADFDPDPACHFDADPDPDSDSTFHCDPDPDATFHFDPDPDPSFQMKAENLGKRLK